MVHELRNIPRNIWLLTGEWIADVMNHTAEKSLQWRPPLEVHRTDCSLLAFYYVSYFGTSYMLHDMTTLIQRPGRKQQVF
jgi:hypothetical protein